MTEQGTAKRPAKRRSTAGFGLAFIRRRDGAVAIEYGILAAMVALIIVAVAGLGQTVSDTLYNKIVGAMNSATASQSDPGGDMP